MPGPVDQQKLQLLINDLVKKGMPEQQAVAYAAHLLSGEPNAKAWETAPLSATASEMVKRGFSLKDAMAWDEANTSKPSKSGTNMISPTSTITEALGTRGFSEPDFSSPAIVSDQYDVNTSKPPPTNSTPTRPRSYIDELMDMYKFYSYGGIPAMPPTPAGLRQ